MSEIKRRYERIDVDLPCRLFIPEGKKGEGLRFEAFSISRNLSLGGLFLESSFALKPDVRVWVELNLPDDSLSIPSRIAHTIPDGHDKFIPGMGVEFLEVDMHAREVLLRYFSPLKYQEFYDDMVEEFPHLERKFEVADTSFILNLWEEWKTRQEGGPPFTAAGAPGPVPRTR
jgi:hypothetical protein